MLAGKVGLAFVHLAANASRWFRAFLGFRARVAPFRSSVAFLTPNFFVLLNSSRFPVVLEILYAYPRP